MNWASSCLNMNLHNEATDNAIEFKIGWDINIPQNRRVLDQQGLQRNGMFFARKVWCIGHSLNHAQSKLRVFLIATLPDCNIL